MLGQRTSVDSTVAGEGWRRSLAVAASRIRVDLAFAAVDVFLVVAAYSVSLGIRMLDPLVGDPRRYWLDLAVALPVVVLVHIGSNVVFGAYGHVWEHASLAEARQVLAANGAAGVLLFCGAVWSRTVSGFVVPYGVVLLGGLLSLSGMGLVRYRSRLFSFRRSPGASRILVVGTGAAAVVFAREAGRVAGQVVGFVSDGCDGLAESARRLAGLPILGELSRLDTLVAEHRVDQIVVAGGGAERARRVVDLCIDTDVRLRILPDLEDVMRNRTATLDVRDISLEDLLSRPAVETDLGALTGLFRGKRVLVTGAGGSIGSEIVRQVLAFEPEVVFALDRDETLLHEAGLRWEGKFVPVLGDVRDGRKLRRLAAEMRPQVVFHAAALKHVPVLEECPDEAVLTNVMGTRNVIEAGSLAGMERFILISTDKAVDPSSVMGASKRIAEMLVQAGAARNDGCVYAAVRFGNVLGSRGSVIPTFIQQIQAGGPVTVTDPEMTRYFMTVGEAVQLVLQAAALASGSEVFVLDMGEPVRIVDLARRLIRLAGLAPERDIPIVYTGRRPGERLAERLSTEPLRPTANRAIFKAELPAPPAASVITMVDLLVSAAQAGDVGRVMTGLREAAGGSFGGPDVVDLRVGVAQPSWS